ncbi:MAG TPA: hypothetical protein VMS54_11410 [Vicinamibacterales bacterium]|nr:hypothetical protein [Vicinamibacterales bacterium]
MQDEEQLQWTSEWIGYLFENMTVIGVCGIAVLAFLYALRNRRYNRPVLTRERWWKRFINRFRH